MTIFLIDDHIKKAGKAEGERILLYNNKQIGYEITPFEISSRQGEADVGAGR